jgi:hypothetical protein
MQYMDESKKTKNIPLAQTQTDRLSNYFTKSSIFGYDIRQKWSTIQWDEEIISQLFRKADASTNFSMECNQISCETYFCVAKTFTSLDKYIFMRCRHSFKDDNEAGLDGYTETKSIFISPTVPHPRRYPCTWMSLQI